jgi:hypothetical protein
MHCVLRFTPNYRRKKIETGYVYEKKKKRYKRREGRYKKTRRRGGGRIYAQRGRRFPSPKNNNASAGENAKNKNKKCRQEDPSLRVPSIGALSVRMCVCVCMCAFPFRQFINFANQGYHQEQEKKFVAVSKKASRYTVLAPALETAPWIWVSDS